MYYQDRLSGQGFSRVLVGGTGRTGTDVEVARRGLEERLGTPVEPIDPTRLALLPDRLNEAPVEHRSCRAARRHAAADPSGSPGRVMLRTNLSTRPFYNVRAVRAIIVGLSTVVVLATAYNVIELARLTTQQRSLSADAVAAETEAGRLTREAAQVRGRIDQTEIDSVAAAAREANAIIDRRAFSWTTLFAQFESALPTDVRITAVQPRRETDGTFAVSVAVQSRRIEAVDGFIEALEALGTFKNVLPTEEQTTEDGLIEAVLDGQYFPEAPAAAATPAGKEPAPKSARAAGNGVQPHD